MADTTQASYLADPILIESFPPDIIPQVDPKGKQPVYRISPESNAAEGPRSQSAGSTGPDLVTQPLSELGTTILSATLMSPDPVLSTYLQLFRSATETWFNLMILRTSPLTMWRDRETVDSFHLGKVQLVPLYALQNMDLTATERSVMEFRTVTGSPVARNLQFTHAQDMFAFQQAMTGYTAVHDCKRVLTTCHEARLLGGKKRQDLSRLQIWTAWQKQNAADEGIPIRSIATASVASPRSPLQQPSLPCATDSRRGSSFALEAGNSYPPSIASNVMGSRGLGSSPYSLGLPFFASASTPITAPIPPCLVLMAHRIPPARDNPGSFMRSFLSIDITQEVILHNEHHPPNICVIEKLPGSSSSYLTARRSNETSDLGEWDLASVGQHKRQTETAQIKKLKHVVIQFDTAASAEGFKTKFEQTQALARLKMEKFLEGRG